jgi:hypothetical protein
VVRCTTSLRAESARLTRKEIVMKKFTIAAILLTIAAPSLAFAGPQPRDANNESSCTASGMGMDPRCVGDVDPSGETAAIATPDVDRMEAAPLTRHAQAPVAKKQRNL